MVSGMYRTIEPAPAFTPHPFGLDSAVAWVNDESPYWQMGVQWRSFCPDAATTLALCVTGSGGIAVPAKAATFEWVWRGARPFSIYTEVDCSAPGSWNDLQKISAEGLLRAEQYELERTFWTGSAAGLSGIILPNLTTTGPIYDGDPAHPQTILLQPVSAAVTGAVLDVVEGLGRLEQALGDCYRGAGVIHVPQLLIPALASQSLVERQGDRLITLNGNQVVAGAGYPVGVGPGGAASAVGSQWMFATGRLFGYRAPIQSRRTVDSFDRSTNSVKMISERTVLLGWDCCLIGVPVGVGGEYSGVYNTTT